MTSLAVLNPHPFWPDTDGNPLDDGRVYFGTPGADPMISPKEAYWEAPGGGASNNPVAQPARTLNGFIVRGNRPTLVYIDGNFSLLVVNRRGERVFFAKNSADFGNAAAVLAQVVASLAGEGGSSQIGFTQVDGILTTVQKKLRENPSAADYGATGGNVGVDSAAIVAGATVSAGLNGTRRLYINPFVATSINLSALGLPDNVLFEDDRYTYAGWKSWHSEGTDAQLLLRARATPFGEGGALTLQNLDTGGNRNSSIVAWWGPSNNPTVASFEHWGYNSPTAASVTFTASVGGASSGTLTAPIPNGVYSFAFGNTEQRKVTVTGGTSCAWSPALAIGPVTTAQPSMWHAGREWLGRGSLDNGFRARHRLGADGGMVFNPTGAPLSFLDNPTIGFAQEYIAVFNAPVQTGYGFSGKNLFNIRAQAVECAVDHVIFGANAATRYQNLARANVFSWLCDFPSANQFVLYDHGISNDKMSFVSGGDITFRGGFKPVVDNLYAIGSATNRPTVLWAVSGTINTSDEREKQDIEGIPVEWLEAWGTVQWVRYKWRDSVEKKGDGARWHVGVIAQRVRDAFEARGVDPFEIGILCYDEWDEIVTENTEQVTQHPPEVIFHPEVVEYSDILGPDGSPIVTRHEAAWVEETKPGWTEVIVPARREVMPAGNRYGIRYEQALAMECAFLRWKAGV